MSGDSVHPGGPGPASDPASDPASGPALPGRTRSSEPRAYVRVVRPGGNAARPGGVPPMPVAPPNSLPPWLVPVTGTAADSGTGTGAGTGSGAETGNGAEALRTDVDSHLAPEERELRELLHRAVSDLQPTPGALEQLRHAVPQRRLRRRRTFGSVAAALALGVIGGAALHSATGSIDTAGGPQTTQSYGDAATSTPTSGGLHPGASPWQDTAQPYPGTSNGGGAASLMPGTPGSGVLQSFPVTGRAGSGSPWSVLSPGHPPVAAPSSTAGECQRSQLGAGTDVVQSADSAGVVYGSFQVTNVSTANCQVSLAGTVAVLSVSGANASQINVLQHTAGDPAGGLPVPAASASPVLLTPGQSYVVDFAWVPAGGASAPACNTATPTTTASPAADPSAAAAPSNTASSGTGGQGSGGTGGTPSVTLGHTPGVGGAVAASAVLPGACAGTVYRTGPLAAG